MVNASSALVDAAVEAGGGSAAAWQLVLAVLGFLTYKVALVGASMGDAGGSGGALGRGLGSGGKVLQGMGAGQGKAQDGGESERRGYKKD